MNQDSDSQPRKKAFAVPAVKLREFHPKCLAVANAGSEVFLLLGKSDDREVQRFEVVRIFDSGSLGKIDEPVAEFETRWRGPALRLFKALLDAKPGGYASIGFMRTQDMAVSPPLTVQP